jgi:A/G-specific adenine glycosylase
LSEKATEVEFQNNLHLWWLKNKRDFPWRNTKDPYQILISEILLHRTNAIQVKPVYITFIKKFPMIESIAESDIESLKQVVYTLGLHWRTPLLHQMACIITKKYNGKIPNTKTELLSLPGVSDYIASAVLCFAFGKPESLLDTNIVRILGRVYGIPITDTSRRSKRFQNLSDQILDKTNAREFNYALLDLGALICLPKKPLCDVCPLSDCKAKSTQEKGSIHKI